MPTLLQLKLKYSLQKAIYEPLSRCKYCGGTGEHPVWGQGGKTPCICLYYPPGQFDSRGMFSGDTISRLAEEAEQDRRGIR